jgi:hypothetical protein
MVRRPIFCGVTFTPGPTNYARDGSVVEYKHDPVDKSRYQEQLEEELLFAAPNEPEPEPTHPDPFVVDESTVRYWSDYNRVNYHPRSILKLPDLPDWDLGMGDWVAGKEEFDKYNNQANFSLEGVAATSYPSVLGWVFIDG